MFSVLYRNLGLTLFFPLTFGRLHFVLEPLGDGEFFFALPAPLFDRADDG